MLAFTLVDLAFVAGISFVVWQYEQRKKVVTGDAGEKAKAQQKVQSEIAGGAEPLVTNAMELELIKRGISLPDRSEGAYKTNPSAYHADLRMLLDKSSALSESLQPTDPKKFEVAVPDSARTIGHTLLDMVQFKRPRVEPQPPPPVEHFDF